MHFFFFVNSAFCKGMAVFDTIAHEWSHAYVDRFEVRPHIELWEAFGDIVGETVDLLLRFPFEVDDGYASIGITSASDVMQQHYQETSRVGRALQRCAKESSALSRAAIQRRQRKNKVLRVRETSSDFVNRRWRIGDASVAGSVRDLFQPHCFAHPSYINDVEQRFVCFNQTMTAVGKHAQTYRNAIVASHAYALLVDGYQFSVDAKRERVAINNRIHAHLTPAQLFSLHQSTNARIRHNDTLQIDVVAGVGLDAAWHIAARALTTHVPLPQQTMQQIHLRPFAVFAASLESVCETLVKQNKILPALAPHRPKVQIQQYHCQHIERIIELTRLKFKLC